MFDPVSLITGGIGLIGSLFGGSSKTEETSESTSTSSIDYKAMVDAATSAGFNPLTAIRTGGASGFVTTNTKSKGESTTSSGPNWGGVADAAGQIAGGLFGGMNNAADPIGSKSGKKGRAISTALVDSQLRGAGKRPAGALYSAAQTIGTKVSSNAPSLRNQARASGPGRSPSGASWLEPPKPSKGDMPLWVAAKDRNGATVWLPNPDGPDIDQWLNPVLARVGGWAEAGARVVRDYSGVGVEAVRRSPTMFPRTGKPAPLRTGGGGGW